jgi:hypothetical protein
VLFVKFNLCRYVVELITCIKMSKIPIICICNDKYNQKLKSLQNYTQAGLALFTTLFSPELGLWVGTFSRYFAVKTPLDDSRYDSRHVTNLTPGSAWQPYAADMPFSRPTKPQILNRMLTIAKQEGIEMTAAAMVGFAFFQLAAPSTSKSESCQVHRKATHRCVTF